MLTGFLSLGCVGPTTPFGAAPTINKSNDLQKLKLQALHGDSETKKSDGFFSPKPQRAKFTLSPPKQKFHGQQSLFIEIYDPKGFKTSSRLRIFFNEVEVGQDVLNQLKTRYNKNRRSLVVEIPNLRLRAGLKNQIEMIYQNTPESQPRYIAWSKPDCSLFENKKLMTTEPFQPSTKILTSIGRWANHYKINPNLVAAVVAQESGFNPKAVSWAKAIGLTQVTPVGDKQVAEFHEDWPRSDQIDRLPASLLKPMIQSGQIKSTEDWRLNPDLSIRGGLTLMNYFLSYWKKENKRNLFRTHFENDSDALTDVILSSYHSGAARVSYQMSQKGKLYLESDQLNEARKYVDRVKSFCYYFAKNQERKISETTP